MESISLARLEGQGHSFASAALVWVVVTQAQFGVLEMQGEFFGVQGEFYGLQIPLDLNESGKPDSFPWPLKPPGTSSCAEHPLRSRVAGELPERGRDEL